MMRRYFRRFPAVLAGLHISLLVISNTNSWWQGYQRVTETPVSQLLVDLYRQPAVALYAHYTGLLGAYGFFAPQVGSPCYVEVGLHDGDGERLEVIDTSTLLSAEGRIRYRSFLNLFYELLPEHMAGQQTDSIRQRIAKAVVHSIGKRVALRQHKQLAYCRVYVYLHPRLRDHMGDDGGSLIQLYAHDFRTDGP